VSVGFSCGCHGSLPSHQYCGFDTCVFFYTLAPKVQEQLNEERKHYGSRQRIPMGGEWYWNSDHNVWVCPVNGCVTLFAPYTTMLKSIDEIIDEMEQHYFSAHFVEPWEPPKSMAHKRGVKAWRARSYV